MPTATPSIATKPASSSRSAARTWGLSADFEEEALELELDEEVSEGIAAVADGVYTPPDGTAARQEDAAADASCAVLGADVSGEAGGHHSRFGMRLALPPKEHDDWMGFE